MDKNTYSTEGQGDWKRAHILLVDDEESMLRALKRTLHRSGFSQISVESKPYNAVQLLTQNQFDLIVLDIQMPSLDGFGLLSFVRRSPLNKQIPVLVLTAKHDRATCIKALSEGANDFILKPSDDEVFLLRVKNLLTNHLLRQELEACNGLLENRVAERTAELKDTVLEVIRKLAITAELKDKLTGSHITRVSKYSRAIAERLNENIDCEMLEHASILHDIGKVVIPDAILMKPGNLTDYERGVVQQHSQIGAQILSGSPHAVIQMAEDIARHHHEKFDGSGYPDQLSGSDISIESRIVAVADVFDALSSSRVYKSADSLESSVQEISRRSGQHFDPVVVDAFMAGIQEIEKIREAFLD